MKTAPTTLIIFTTPSFLKHADTDAAHATSCGCSK